MARNANTHQNPTGTDQTTSTDEIRHIKDHFTAQVNGLVGTGDEHLIAGLTRDYDEELREAARRAA